MGGHVQVSSQPGAGSVFEVVLPAAAAPAPPVAAASSAATPLPSAAEAVEAAEATAPQQQRHVLYIEDNPVNALIVREMALPGYRLSVAEDGASGIAAALREQPDLVLLDMQLPDMDGFAVLSRLREQPRTAALPVVAVSANVMPEQVQRGLAGRLADCWTKPLDMTTFLFKLRALLPAEATAANGETSATAATATAAAAAVATSAAPEKAPREAA